MRDVRTVEEQREDIRRSVVDEGDTQAPDPLNGLSPIPGLSLIHI